jgi:hypothetical protein
MKKQTLWRVRYETQTYIPVRESVELLAADTLDDALRHGARPARFACGPGGGKLWVVLGMTFDVYGTATVSCYLRVEADSQEEAAEKAADVPIRCWSIDCCDGEVCDIEVEARN